MNAIIADLFGKREATYDIRREVARRYEEERKRSGFWHRGLIWWKIERAVRAELKQKHPPHALYGAL